MLLTCRDWELEKEQLMISRIKANVLCFARSDSHHITGILCIAGLLPESPCHVA
jgi:hypothetical protein